MTTALSFATMDLVKATAPAIQRHGLAITQRMYERLFVNDAIKRMFDEASQDRGEQPKRLAATILGYAQNIDKLQNLSGAVTRMVARHVECAVRADHYPFVAEALLPAIKDVLGDAATDEVLTAWGEAYWFLANILIDAETAKYVRPRAATRVKVTCSMLRTIYFFGIAIADWRKLPRGRIRAPIVVLLANCKQTSTVRSFLFSPTIPVPPTRHLW